MYTILRELTNENLTWAIEASIFEVYQLLRYWPKVEVHDEPEIFWTLSNIPFPLFNNALRTRLNPAQVDESIQAVIDRCRARHVPLNWNVGPSTLPANLGLALERQGCKFSEIEVGMALDLRNLKEDPPAPPSLVIEAVEEGDKLRQWAQVCGEGFEFPDFATEAFFEWFLSMGFGDAVPVRNYLGLLNGKPVAASTLYPGAGVAGVYCVATIPGVRRQGIGAAMTAHTLKEGRAMVF